VINQFKKNETYYLFLIFAKDTTEQTYRFYVGKDTASSLTRWDGAGQHRTEPVVFKNHGFLPAGRARWFDEGQGVVEVTVKVADLPDLAKKIADAKERKVPTRDLLHVEQGRRRRVTTAHTTPRGNCTDSGPRRRLSLGHRGSWIARTGLLRHRVHVAGKVRDRSDARPTPWPRVCLQRRPPGNGVPLTLRGRPTDGVCPQNEATKLLDDFCLK
jgi:hypothetical protein